MPPSYHRFIQAGALALLFGIIAAIIAAWLGIRPEPGDDIAAWRYMLEPDAQLSGERSWIEANPVAFGLAVGAATFAGILLSDRVRSR